MLKRYLFWYISLLFIRASGILNLLVDVHTKSFRRGCLVNVTTVLLRALFWRNAAAIDEITWLSPELEATVAAHGAMLA